MLREEALRLALLPEWQAQRAGEFSGRQVRAGLRQAAILMEAALCFAQGVSL